MASTSLGFNIPSEETIALFDFDVLIDGYSLQTAELSRQVEWTPSASVEIQAEVDISLKEALSTASLINDKQE